MRAKRENEKSSLMRRVTARLAVAVVAACLAVLALAPGAALAASITLKGGGSLPVSVYTGSSYTLKVASTTVKWYSSNKKVATIGMTTGKLEVLAPGEVTITAKSKNSGNTVASRTITVRQRAKSVTASPSEIILGNVGDTAKLTAKLSPSTSTDVVRFESSDKTIATVGETNGKVTAKKEGTCTIKVIAKATKTTSNASDKNKVCEVQVRVGPYLTAAECDGIRVFATLKGGPKDLKEADFTLTNDVTKMVSPIKSVKRDGNQVILLPYNYIDEGSYTLAFGKTSIQVDSPGVVIDSVKLTPDTIVAGMETPVKVQLVTYKGSVIEESDLSGRGLGTDYDVKVKDGYQTGGALCLWEPGMSATVEVVKHTWKYENGQEVGVLSWEATVTAREPEEGEAAPTYDARSVSYSYSGGVGGTVNITLSDALPPTFTAEDFTVKLKPNGSSGRAEYVPDAASVSGKSISLTISSSDLTNGRTYEVYCTKAPIAKKLGEFTVVKYSYSPPAYDDTPTEDPSEEFPPSSGDAAL